MRRSRPNIIVKRRFVNCADPMCAAYTLTTQEFMLLRGEDWPQSFRTTLGKAAGKLYEQLYGKKRSRKVRTHLMAQTARNKVRTYPCGILEQAYRALIAAAPSVCELPQAAHQAGLDDGSITIAPPEGEGA
jgi:hypothetical protein